MPDAVLCFNPRARRGRDNHRSGRNLQNHRFQSTRPQGARPVMTPVKTKRQQFQSTRPQGARLMVKYGMTPETYVSIHAPAGGATAQKHRAQRTKTMFQSTRPQGARPKVWNRKHRISTGFNPRARRGRDPTPKIAVDHMARFQSTRPQGARHNDEYGSIITARFQSTRPQGARPQK